MTRRVMSAVSASGASLWRLSLAAVAVSVLVGCAPDSEPAQPAFAPAEVGTATNNPGLDTDRPSYTRYDTNTDGNADDRENTNGGGDPTGGTEDGDLDVPDDAGDGDHVSDGGDTPDADDAGEAEDAGEAIGDGDSTADESDDPVADGAVGEDGPDEDTAGGGDVLGDTGEGNDTGGDAAAVIDNGDGGEGGVVLDDGAVVDVPDGASEDVSVGAEVEVADVRLVVDGFGGVLVEGPCGWLGPVCPLVEGADPIDAGGRLAYSESREDWSPWVGRVLDLCDDHEALTALNKKWYIGSAGGIDYSATIPPEAMEFVHAERQRHPVVCSRAEALIPLWKCWGDGSGRTIARLREYLSEFAEPLDASEVEAWAENQGVDCWDAAAAGARYVYITANGPLLPQRSVEAAVEDYLERVAQAGDEGDLTTGYPLGATINASWGHPVETPADALFVLSESVSVKDGVLRGLAQNHSELLWARDATITATDPNGGTGQWRWPLTVQPGETFPFAIENWTGPQTPSEINFTITADLSPTIDLTRSLELSWYKYYDTKGTYLFYHDYPEEMGAFPHGTTAFEALDNGDRIGWIEFDIRRRGSTAHPRFVETAQQQTVENLTVYAALLEIGIVVEEVWEMTPMNPTRGQFGDGSEEAQARGDWDEWKKGDWVEARTITTLVDDWDAFWEAAESDPDSVAWYWNSPIGESATVGFVGDSSFLYIWAGGATPDPSPPDETTQ